MSECVALLWNRALADEDLPELTRRQQQLRTTIKSYDDAASGSDAPQHATLPLSAGQLVNILLAVCGFCTAFASATLRFPICLELAHVFKFADFQGFSGDDNLEDSAPPHRHIASSGLSCKDNHPLRETLDRHLDSLATSELGSLAAISSLVTEGSEQISQSSKGHRPGAVPAKPAKSKHVKRKVGANKGTPRDDVEIIIKKARPGSKADVQSQRGPLGRASPTRVKQVSTNAEVLSVAGADTLQLSR